MDFARKGLSFETNKLDFLFIINFEIKVQPLKNQLTKTLCGHGGLV